jgi:hypothetical protein
VFSIIPKLDTESRQVLFMLVAKGMHNGMSEITPAGIAAHLLRSPRVEDVCSNLGISSGDLLGALESLEMKSTRPGGGGGGTTSAGAAPAMTEEEGPEAQVGALGMFAALPLSGSGQRLLESLTVDFANVTEQSVTTPKLLALILEHNDDVRNVCTRHGLTVDQLRAGDVA